MSDLPSYPTDAAEREAATDPSAGGREYASWGRRVGATILDTLVLLIPVLVLSFIIGFAIGWNSEDDDGALAAATGVGYLVGIVLPVIYYTYFHGRDGQTLGKRWVGIRVVGDSSREPIGYGRAFGRYAITLVLSILVLPVLLDYLWPLWDKKNQALHDKVVGSAVVKA